MEPVTMLRSWPQHLRFSLLIALIGLAAVMGGSSRGDAFGAPVVQPLAILFATIGLLVPGPVRWREFRAPMLLLLALAMLMITQVIPFPAGIWTAVPGREPFVRIIEAAGLPLGARPISVAPDLTLSSLAWLAVPASVLVLSASLPGERVIATLPYLLGIALLSVLVGLAQLLGGDKSAFYLYRVVSETSASGFFANRNHQGAFMVSLMPVVALLAATWERAPSRRALYTVAAAGMLLLIANIGVIGSRAALLLAPLGLAGALLVFACGRPDAGKKRVWSGRHLAIASVAILALALAAYLISDTAAVRRLFGGDAANVRAMAYPHLVELLKQVYPLGTGFGTFDLVFRVHEPLVMLRPTYLNNAHNDLIELVITGGLPAIAILAGFLSWLAIRVMYSVRGAAGSRRRAAALAGLSIVAILFAASLVDYPLRTPALAALAALAVALAVPWGIPSVPKRAARVAGRTLPPPVIELERS
ncbi:MULTISPECIES: O-antigen ligase [unclassified Sphingomonas]|uniref:O-antigen ligase family protein n=1 Tax=unclassified Sphingomonas TaxID=196159 RepID=UPI0021516F19|nr:MULTISPECIES: O-antigen ligase family protein [unclassified Sphingomonas]MCR5871112.1 O-antigen ligase family protein [Sphingomonas sp. J344]UUY00571.1 O-antigen ligase family protein [Sphingomonas sp. J315]